MSDNPTITILYSTQSGRAKACARRSSRLLRTKYPSINISGNCSFDEYGVQNFLALGATANADKHLLLLFVSTTGDGEHTTSIAKTWNALLSKSLPKTLFASVSFALFALGDRAYGDAFCAAGRKLAARLVQLGASPSCVLGYGDDGSGAGALGDLDVWLGESLFGVIDGFSVDTDSGENAEAADMGSVSFYSVEFSSIDDAPNIGSSQSDGTSQEWQRSEYLESYADYFQCSCPDTAYQYNAQCIRLKDDKSIVPRMDGSYSTLTPSAPPLLGSVTVNERITSEEWMQNTRHLRIHVNKQMRSAVISGVNLHSLPYQAGDVATILPSNPDDLVSRFLSILPHTIASVANKTIRIQRIRPEIVGRSYSWPKLCTLHGLLTYCADLQSLPEQEDLFALSAHCNMNHSSGKDQRDKLISLSETSGAALYADYIVRNKRNWVDLFYDFDSILFCENDANPLPILSNLLSLLPSIAPRHFSIASSPTYIGMKKSSDTTGFDLELCVAVVEGTTTLGRTYSGCCSSYLASLTPSKCHGPENNVRLWITPGSFHELPLEKSTGHETGCFFQTPILCIGSGTGIAPLRSLIFEREAVRLSQTEQRYEVDRQIKQDDSTLVFGCRKRLMDYYYGMEWESLVASGHLRLIHAFSRDQKEKLYAQRALREIDDGSFIVHHVLERHGAVYIAGGSKMARAVKDEIVKALGAVLEGGEPDAKKLLNVLKRKGHFSIEAWS